LPNEANSSKSQQETVTITGEDPKRIEELEKQLAEKEKRRQRN